MTNSDTRIRYLLGLSAAAEREQIEAEYFEDDDAFQELLAAEDDLFDAYARGELGVDERWKFEKRFASSLPGNDRVQFARAFAGAVGVDKANFSVLPFFQRFLLPALLRTAPIIVVIAVVVVVLAWLIIDRKRKTNEVDQPNKQTEALRLNGEAERSHTDGVVAQRAGPQQQLAKPQRRSSRTTPSQQARRSPEIRDDRKEIVGKLKPNEDQVNTPDTYFEPIERAVRSPDPSLTNSDLPPTNNSSSTLRGAIKDPNGDVVAGAKVKLTNTETNFSRDITSNDSGQFAFESLQPGAYNLEVEAQGFKKAALNDIRALVAKAIDLQVEMQLGTINETISLTVGTTEPLAQDASLSRNLVTQQMAQRPLSGRHLAGSLSLELAMPSGGVPGRNNQANLKLDGIDTRAPLATYSLVLRTTDHAVTVVRVPNSPSWITFRLPLTPRDIHRDYRITIQTADGRFITSEDWLESQTPNQILIDTPSIQTTDLPPGNHVLSLMGKEPDGSFSKIAEYSFRIISL